MDWFKEHQYIAVWIAAFAGIAALIPWSRVFSIRLPSGQTTAPADKKKWRHRIFVWGVWAIELVLMFGPHNDPKAVYVAGFMVVVIPLMEFLDSRTKPPSEGTGAQGR
jgi:hypothetical protein